MSPFRDAPEVELGPLDVGLPEATARAIACLPRGGRVLAVRGRPQRRRASHVIGAVGSAGVIAFVLASAAAWAVGWRPASVVDLALVLGVIVLGGASLAAVLSALEHGGGAATRRGDVVGAEAQAILRRMTRLALLMRRGRMVPGVAGALRSALVAASDPDLVCWIPRDVRGRAELLLARTLVVSAGHRLTPSVRCEARALLVAAAEHLDQRAPAEADLVALDRAPLRIASPRRADDDADDRAVIDEARASMRL